MSELEKIVQLERAINASGQQGSFGFSILGGGGTKFPAVVCEVDQGGPADLTGKVFVGDQLTMLNGEDLAELRPAELVQRIRTAPSPSTFVLLKDEALQQQVIALLWKQERRAQARQRSEAISTSDVKSAESPKQHALLKKTSSPALGNAIGGGVGSEEHRERRRKRHERIIEVEPSVNINATGNIIKVLDNKIIGRVDQAAPTEWLGPSDGASPRHGRHKSPPSPASQDHRVKQFGEKLEESPPHRQARGFSPGNVSTNSAGEIDLEQRTSLSPFTAAAKSTSLDSFSHTSGGSSVGSRSVEMPQENLVAEGLNGDVRSFSDSSGINSMSDNVTVTSFEEQTKASRLSDLGSKLASATATNSPSFSESPNMSNHIEDSGIAVHIPKWPLALEERKARGSLSEDVFISELERKPISQLALNTKLPSPTEEKAELAPKEDSPKIMESPTRLPDPELRDQLMKMYRTSSRGSAKKHHDPYTDAVTLARKLYMLDGFKKSEVAEKLADMSEFGQTVAKEYLKFFEFDGVSLDDAIRQFLSFFSLTGESQERERVMEHFSDRYFQCNQDSKVFTSPEVVHGLTIALLLLNTDLHAQHTGPKITFSQFSSGLKDIDVKIPKDMLKRMFENIKRKQFVWAEDAQEPDAGPHSSEEDAETMRTYHVTIPGTFVEVELPGKAMVFKEGFVARKNVMEGSHKKGWYTVFSWGVEPGNEAIRLHEVPRGKRQWKAYYGFLKGFLLYFAPPQGELHLDNTSSAVSITHCLAMRAHDYRKRGAVVRVTTSDWHAFLLQTSNVTDMQQWIGAINKAAALYSSPPLAAPVSSNSKFQRPTFPIAPTKYSMEQQIEAHDTKVKQLEKEMQEHHAYKPTGKHAKHGSLQDWFDKYEFLQFEINRFRIYYASLTTDTIVDFNAPLPSGLVPSPSVSTLATPGSPEDELLFTEYRSASPPSSPSAQRLGPGPYISHSPLLNSKKRS